MQLDEPFENLALVGSVTKPLFGMGTKPATLQMMDMVLSPETVRVQNDRAIAVKNMLVEILPDRELEIAALENHGELRVRITERTAS